MTQQFFLFLLDDCWGATSCCRERVVFMAQRDTREARVLRRGRARSGGGVWQCDAHTGAHFARGHLAAGGGTPAL